MTRIYKDRFYVIAVYRGGDEWDSFVTRGANIYSRAEVQGEFNPIEWANTPFRIENGRVPEHQPLVSGTRLLNYLKDNPNVKALAMPRLATPPRSKPYDDAAQEEQLLHQEQVERELRNSGITPS